MGSDLFFLIRVGSQGNKSRTDVVVIPSPVEFREHLALTVVILLFSRQQGEYLFVFIRRKVLCLVVRYSHLSPLQGDGREGSGRGRETWNRLTFFRFRLPPFLRFGFPTLRFCSAPTRSQCKLSHRRLF